ncbi:MAG: hypothetical protein HYW34_04245 [Candidatus Brennerbacteria bacterium]|nr:hypothetical protein [Candidatus Brennerbacteria bacterium]
MKTKIYISTLFIPVAAAVFFVLTPVSVFAATYYIAPSPTGSDANSGTSLAPFATFSKAFSVMAGGDTLIIKDGTYNQSLKNPPSGTAQGYTIVKAENLFNPIIDGEGLTDPALYIQNGRHHIQIEGIYFKGANISGKTEVATIGEDLKCCDQGQTTDGASYINLFRNIFQGRNLAETNVYSKVLGVAVSNNITLEENISFGKANKYHFFAYKSSNITMRRNFARWDAVNTSTQGAGHPSASFIFYDTGNSIMENNVAVDGVHTSDTTTAAFYLAGHYIGGNNNQFLGNIALNNKANSAFEIDPGANFRSDGAPINWNNQTLTNNVAWLSNDDPSTSAQDGLGVGINIGQSGTGGPYIDNVTVSHNTVGKNTKNRGISIHHNPTNTIFKNNLILFNSIVANCSDSILNINTSVLFGNISTTAGTGCTINMNGNLSADPGLMYLNRIETGSSAKGTADDGGDIGANLLKQYENGVLTGTDLWPFPNENVIKKVACTDTGETRGFCAAESLTKYIWEYLGNPIPPEIYATTLPSDTTPPNPPTGLMIQ